MSKFNVGDIIYHYEYDTWFFLVLDDTDFYTILSFHSGQETTIQFDDIELYRIAS